MLYVWYLKKRRDWYTIHEENGVIQTPEKVMATKTGQAYLFGNQNRSSESLQDSVVMKLLQDYESSLT